MYPTPHPTQPHAIPPHPQHPAPPPQHPAPAPSPLSLTKLQAKLQAQGWHEVARGLHEVCMRSA